MIYDVIVQGKLYRTFQSDNGYNFVILNEEVKTDIKNGVFEVDENLPLDIHIVKK